MATKAKENYLKALYHLHLKNEEISLSELGRNLELSKPTVNDMVKKCTRTAGSNMKGINR